jgi:hypothetical protein
MLIFKGLPGTTDPYVKIMLFNSPTIQLFELLDKWSLISKKNVIINAIDNGTHGPNTLHGLSLAWDLGIEGHQLMDFQLLGGFLKVRLPLPYEIVIESDHVHVEWDTHRGR